MSTRFDRLQAITTLHGFHCKLNAMQLNEMLFLFLISQLFLVHLLDLLNHDKKERRFKR